MQPLNVYSLFLWENILLIRSNSMKKILFVCLGNICRSPAAEGILNTFLENHNLKDKYLVDSAGLLDYHEGENYDSRMISFAADRGYKLEGFSRPFTRDDFSNFDMIIAMDNEVHDSILSFDKTKKHQNKIYKMTDFSSNQEFDEVPDPYYLGKDGFETALDIIEDSCKGLLNKLKSNDLEEH
jgi:protein-tyrosine phosphatase